MIVTKRIGSIFLLLAALGSTGCTTGRTAVSQTYFLAIPSGEKINFYRIRINAETRLGETEFRSGWFPAAAVDSLYGDVSKSGVTEAYRMQEDLKAKFNAAILHTTEGWLSVAQDPKSDPALREAWLAAQRRVRSVAGAETPLPVGAVEIEYDPGGGLTTHHADEKLVLVLSSDPDTVIGAITAYSTDVQTSATVMRLADVLRQRSANDLEATEARNAARQKMQPLLKESIDAALNTLEGNPGRDQLMSEIRTLRYVVESVQ